MLSPGLFTSTVSSSSDQTTLYVAELICSEQFLETHQVNSSICCVLTFKHGGCDFNATSVGTLSLKATVWLFVPFRHCEINVLLRILHDYNDVISEIRQNIISLCLVVPPSSLRPLFLPPFTRSLPLQFLLPSLFPLLSLSFFASKYDFITFQFHFPSP